MKRTTTSALFVGGLLAGSSLAVLAGRSIFSRSIGRRLKGAVVLITGGSRGLGFALARECLAIGCRVAICARDEAELRHAKWLLQEHGQEVLAVPCDVTDRAAVQEMIQEVRSWAGTIDVLINNAGQISVAPLEDCTIEDFERAMNVMFWGVLHPTLEVLHEMKRRGSGRIATITSVGGKVSIPHLLPYCCAKFAAVGFMEGLRAEMAAHGVSITTIAPGLMRTGSHLKAEFKGNQQAESTWFSLAATLPGVSMDATRAARQILRAVERGESERILSPQANLLARINGALPGLMPNILGLVSRLLPEPTGNTDSRAKGEDLVDAKGDWFRALTVLGRRAAEQLNQV